MSPNSKTQLIQQLFASFESQQREQVEPLLAEHFSFTSPYDNALDRQAYLEQCWPNAAQLQNLLIEQILVEGDMGMIRYQASTPEGVTFRNCECFNFVGEQIASIEVYFGAAYHQGVFTRLR